MGTHLTIDRDRDLRDWWGGRITNLLREDLATSPGTRVLVSLTSQECFAAVGTDRLKAWVIAPRFGDCNRNGTACMISFHAGRAHGVMVGWLVRNRVRSVVKLPNFIGNGHVYDEQRSTPGVPVFVR